MDYDELCKNILELDSKIRFVGVVNTTGVLIKNVTRDDMESLLSSSELKMSLHYSMQEWEKSQNLSHKIGNEKASVIEYDLVTLVSIPLNNRNLFVASIEPNADYFNLISKMKPVIQNITEK